MKKILVALALIIVVGVGGTGNDHNELTPTAAITARKATTKNHPVLAEEICEEKEMDLGLALRAIESAKISGRMFVRVNPNFPVRPPNWNEYIVEGYNPRNGCPYVMVVTRGTPLAGLVSKDAGGQFSVVWVKLQAPVEKVTSVTFRRRGLMLSYESAGGKIQEWIQFSLYLAVG